MRVYRLLAPFWNVGSKIGGLNRALNKYVERVAIPLPSNPRILEVGCGTGIISFALLKKFEDTNILATDGNKAMLKTASSLASKKGLSSNRLMLGESDINSPFKVRLLNAGAITLLPESFDMIVASAVLEHSRLDQALPALLQLLNPGGYLFIVSMSDSFFGRLYGYIYQFKPISKKIINLLEAHKCPPTVIPFDSREFPINLRRVGMLARKSK